MTLHTLFGGLLPEVLTMDKYDYAQTVAFEIMPPYTTPVGVLLVILSLVLWWCKEQKLSVARDGALRAREFRNHNPGRPVIEAKNTAAWENVRRNQHGVLPLGFLVLYAGMFIAASPIAAGMFITWYYP